MTQEYFDSNFISRQGYLNVAFDCLKKGFEVINVFLSKKVVRLSKKHYEE